MTTASLLYISIPESAEGQQKNALLGWKRNQDRGFGSTLIYFSSILNSFQGEIFYAISACFYSYIGGFQLLDLIIPELKSHVIPYKFKLIGGKFICKKKSFTRFALNQ